MRERDPTPHFEIAGSFHINVIAFSGGRQRERVARPDKPVCCNALLGRAFALCVCRSPAEEPRGA
jgi:hypothetical protein